MLPEIKPFDRQVTLVGDSGIQFMDFGLTLGREPAGEFVELASGVLTRLLCNEEKDFLFFQPRPDAIEKARPKYDIALKNSLELLDGIWLPLPLFRFNPPHFYNEGPINWARFRIVQLPEPDLDGYTHRLTLVFDTRIMAKLPGAADLGPNQEDVSAGATFQVATSTYALGWYLTQPWLKEWLLEIFNDASKGRDRDERESEIKQQYPVAHYLNVLSLLAKPVDDQQTKAQPKVEI
ncbi:MAG: virulence factor SrfB, partial [Aeromonas sp.]